jgi:hypothetical protein
MNHFLSNRLLLVCASLFLLVALVVALRVIPAVKSDMSPNALPERAVAAFWVNVGFNLLLSASCGAIAVWSRGRDRFSTASLVLLGVVALLLGLALLDAGSAFRSHEMLARGTSIFLFACATVDMLAGALVLLVTYRRPKKM